MNEEQVLTEEFRSGVPTRTMGNPFSHYIYCVLLDDGTTTDAYRDMETVGGETRWYWRKPVGDRERLTNVVGWRTEVECRHVQDVIFQYVEKPHGVVARGEFGKALDLHIRMEEGPEGITCQPCAAAFVRAWQNRYGGATPEGWESFARGLDGEATA